MIRICHLGDTHLSDRETVAGRIVLDAAGRNVRSLDRVRCFRSAITGAIERDCDLVVHAGDLYEHNKPWPSEECAAIEILDLLGDDRPLAICADNHGNVESCVEKHAIEPLIGRRPWWYVFTRPELRVIPTKSGPVQVAGLPSPQRSTLAATEECKGLSPVGLNALISDKLRKVLRFLRSQLDPSLPAILVAHLKIAGAWMNAAKRADDYGEIVLSPTDFAGWDYVALGDFHRCQSVAPNAWYSGSTDRCDFGEEANTPCWLYVECAETVPGIEEARLVPVILHVPTPSRRFQTFSPDELERVPWDPDVIYRVKGEVGQAQYDAMQPLLTYWRGNPLFSEELEVTRTTRVRSEAMGKSLTDEEALREWCVVNGREGEFRTLLEEHRILAGK